MNTTAHDFVTVDMRGLKAALVARAQAERVSVSVLVRGAVARVDTRFMGRDIGIYQTGPSNAGGDIYDFNPTQGTGATPGDYTLYPLITKAGGRCRDDQPMNPVSYILRVKN